MGFGDTKRLLVDITPSKIDIWVQYQEMSLNLKTHQNAIC